MTRPARSVKKPSRIHRLAMDWAKAHCRAMAAHLSSDRATWGPYNARWSNERDAQQKLLTACIRDLGKSRRAEKNRKRGK